MDKKQALILCAAMAAASLGSWELVSTALRPAAKEDAGPHEGPFSFPAPGEPTPQPEGPALQASPLTVQPSPYSRNAQTGRSSPAGESGLGFIQKDESAKPSAPSPPPPAAPAAADSRPERATASLPPEPPSPAALRQAMQRVVDLVHRRQPAWYSEFLRHRDLKEAADDYNSTNDFPAFLAALARSASFARMLSTRVGKKPLRDLVSDALKEPGAEGVMDVALADPNGKYLADLYASKAGDSRPGAPEPPTRPVRRLKPSPPLGKAGDSPGGQRLKSLNKDGFIDSGGGFAPKR